LLVLQFRSEQIDILEKEELRFDHADVGVNLLKIWNLSGFHMKMVTFHQKINHSSHFSDVLAYTMQWGKSGEQPFSPKLQEEPWENLKIFDKISLFDLNKKI
jgi:hypothetical protein